MLRSLGKVTTTAGTPIRLTTNESVPGTRYAAHSFLVEALSSNTGAIYVGTSTMNRTTLAGVFAVIPPPTANNFPSFTATVSYSANHFNLAEIYLDVATSAEGALVSCVRS